MRRFGTTDEHRWTQIAPACPPSDGAGRQSGKTIKINMKPRMDTGERGAVNSLTEKIIGCAYEVSNVLGCGFLEKVYENALAHELKRKGLAIDQQYEIEVYI